MGRRRFIKAATAAGIGASTLMYGSQEAIAKQSDDDEVAIVDRVRVTQEPNPETGQQLKREPVYRRIERSRWNRLRATKRAGRNIEKRIRDKWGETPIATHWVAFDDSASGFKIRVLYQGDPEPSKEEVRDYLPDQASGEAGGDRHNAPVEVVEGETHLVGEQDCTDNSGMAPYDWSEGPGGALMDCPQASGGEGATGTTCGTFVHTDHSPNKYGLVASGHVMEEVRNDLQWSRTPGKWHAGDAYEVINETNDLIGSTGVDCAFIRMRGQDGYSQQSQIADPSNDGTTDYPIDGIITNDSLMTAADNCGNYPFYTQGAKTKRIYGCIKGLGYKGGFGNNNNVLSDHTVDHGDSGGPLYYINDNGSAFIGGTIYAHYNPNSLGQCGGALSTTAETVEDRLGGAFY